MSRSCVRKGKASARVLIEGPPSLLSQSLLSQSPARFLREGPKKARSAGETARCGLEVRMKTDAGPGSGESRVLTGPRKAATGIKGFDEITGGGLPSGRPTLLTGACRSGQQCRSAAWQTSARDLVEPLDPGGGLAWVGQNARFTGPWPGVGLHAHFQSCLLYTSPSPR